MYIYKIIKLSFICCLINWQMGFAQKNTNYEIIIEHYFGNQPLEFDQAYITELGDTIYLNKLQYYLSNFQLTSAKGKAWQEKNSYHLVRIEEGKSQTKIQLQNLPKTDYQQLSFSLGIDSIRNHTGAQTGDLDPINGMFWTWEQGYIFFKCEGYYLPDSEQRRGLVYHLGRAGCYRVLNFDIPKDKNQIILKVDLKKMFGGLPNAKIDLKIKEGKPATNIMGGTKAPLLADNCLLMFELKK